MYQNPGQDIERIKVSEQFIDNKLYYYLKPTDSFMSRFDGEPKLHHNRVHVCPNVSYSGSLLYSFKGNHNNTNSSTTFYDCIRNVLNGDDKIIVLFIVTFLYTDILIIDSLNIIKNYVNYDDQFTEKMAIPKDRFFELVNLVLRPTYNTFNSQFYQQIDDVPMAGPATSTTAKICMQGHKETTMSTALHPPKVWERFDDVVYSILKFTHVESFFHPINDQNISFTMEEESNGELAFSDTMLKRDNEKISLVICRRPAHSDQYLH